MLVFWFNAFFVYLGDCMKYMEAKYTAIKNLATIRLSNSSHLLIFAAMAIKIKGDTTITASMHIHHHLYYLRLHSNVLLEDAFLFLCNWVEEDHQCSQHLITF